MSHRMLLVAFALTLALGASNVASAATTTPISVSVLPGSAPSSSLNSGYLVVRIFRLTSSSSEIGLYDQTPLVSGPPYPVTVNVDSAALNLPGPFIIRTYILDPQRHIFYYSETNFPTAPKAGTPLILRVAEAPGTEILPTGSAGTLLLLASILSLILAGGVALWRRRRSHVLTQLLA